MDLFHHTYFKYVEPRASMAASMTCTRHFTKWLALWLLHALLVARIGGSPLVVTVNVDTSSPVFTTEERFFSLGMDSNLIRHHWETFDFTSVRLRTLAKSLAPAYLRFSGTDGDRMIFDAEDFNEINHSESGTTKNQTFSPHGGSPQPYRRKSRNDIEDPEPGAPTLFPPTNFTFTPKDWDQINRFALDVGWRIMFGLNAQLRKGSDWDPSNAMALLEYSIHQGYENNLDFELGNEPDLYFTEKHLHVLSGKQLANDYKFLRKLLDTEFKARFSSAKLYGPALAHMVPVISPLFLKAFMDNMEPGVLAGVTWHQYYGGSELKYVENYTDPSILDMYKGQCKDIVDIVQGSRQPHIKIWQGETSSTYAPPGGSIDESYVAGFMLLDKLGLSARCGMELVIRQTFYGFWFALVDDKLQATPNYWASLLFRNLVGQRILHVETNLREESVRVYAHCVSPRSAEHYNSTAIVLYAMNLLDEDVTLDLSKLGQEVFQYVLTPGKGGGLLSGSICLNGLPLHMVDDQTVPRLFGLFVFNPSRILLPAKTFGFFVVADANAQGCM